MAKITLNDVTAGQSNVNVINANSDTLETFSTQCLTRDGTDPNDMNVNLDMGNNKIINVVDPDDDQDAATKSYVDDSITAANLDVTTSIATNTSNIATNTSNISTNTTNIATNTAKWPSWEQFTYSAAANALPTQVAHGLPERPKMVTWFWVRTGPNITHFTQNRFYYQPGLDSGSLPNFAIHGGTGNIHFVGNLNYLMGDNGTVEVIGSLADWQLQVRAFYWTDPA